MHDSSDINTDRWIDISGNFCTSFDWEYQNSLIAMQSTGLKDFNGKEIFEGDLIEVQYDIDPCGIGNPYNSIDTTQYFIENVTLFLRWIGSMEPIEKIQVKGNLYENPELFDKVNVSKSLALL